MNLINRLFGKSESINLGKLRNSNTWYPMSLLRYYFAQSDRKNFVEKGFGTNPYVYMVIKKIADVVSDLLTNHTELQNQAGNVIEESPIIDLIDNPEHWHEVIENLMATGNAWINGMDAEGFSGYRELTVLKSKNTKIISSNSGEIQRYESLEFGKWNHYDIDNTLLIKFPNIVKDNNEGLYGFSPLEVGKMVYESSNNIFEAEAAIFKNRGVVSMLTNDTDTPLLPNEIDRIQQDFQDQTAGADKFGKIGVTNTKLRLLQLGMSPSDLKLIESNINKLRIICGIYGLDSKLFGDPESSTYNNVSEAQKAAYTNTYIPVANLLIRNYNNWLIKDSFKSTDKLVLNTDNVDALKAVNKDLTDKTIQEFNNGLIDRDEARDVLGYE